MATFDDLMDQPSDRLRQARVTQQKILARHQALTTSEPSSEGSLSDNEIDFERVEGRNDDIMGVLKRRVAKQPRQASGGESDRSLGQQYSGPNFTSPSTREIRLQTIDGHTSFHFDHQPISKTSHPKTDAAGRKVRKGSAAEHNRYIERDDAVAQIDGEEPGLAQTPSELIDRSTPAGHDLYIARQEAMAIQPDGSHILFTNIDDDPTKRDEYWRLVEAHERESSPDTLSFRPAANPDFWALVKARADCPKILGDALKASDPCKTVTIETGDNKALRGWLSQVEGFVPIPTRRQGESHQAYASRRKTAQSFVDFKDGRDGRVQYRIVGELPHELDINGRSAIVADFAQEFARRRLPFVAVMHAPDHANNDKNWHFHLVYHDRPARRVTSNDIMHPPKDSNPRNTQITQLSAVDIGRWDFHVEQDYLTSSREKRTRFPLRQKKLREVTRDDWVKMLRRRLADISNAQLELAGKRRRLDPRSLEEMGIKEVSPQEHLGTKAASLEALGIATATGSKNEAKQWSAINKQIDRQQETDLEECQATARSALATLSTPDKDGAANLKAAEAIHRWYQLRSETIELEAIANRIEQNVLRLLSRATKVSGTCARYLDAISNGTASRRDGARVDDYQFRKDEADTFIEAAELAVSPDRSFAQDCRAASRRYDDEAGQLLPQFEISGQVGDGMRQQGAPPVAGTENETKPKARRYPAMNGLGVQF